MIDTYIVNGVDLSTLAFDIQTAEGLQRTPGWQGADIAVAGWHGALDPHAEPGQPRRAFKPGLWKVSMRVLGIDPVTGAAPADPDDVARYLANVDTLTKLFHARTLTITHPRADGDRQAVGHLAGDPLDFTRVPSSPWFGTFAAEVVLPDPFWYEPTPVSASHPGLPSGGTLSLAPFAKATAPMRASELRFGPGNNPSLAHAGGFWSWGGVIAAGRELVAQTNPRDPALVGVGSWAANTPAYDAISYGPGPSWFEIDPTAPTAVLSHTGGGLMPVSVTARIAHLTS